MRTKLSEKYQLEREELCNKIIALLELNPENSFLLYDLDNDIKKINTNFIYER